MKNKTPQIELFKTLLSSLECENEIYAKVLHDDVFPQILAAKLRYTVTKTKIEKLLPPEFIEELDIQHKEVAETLDILKHVYYALFPSLLKQLGLAKSVRQAVTDFCYMYESNVNICFDGYEPEPTLNDETRVLIYRAMCAALKEVLKINTQLEFDLHLDFSTKKITMCLLAVSEDGHLANKIELTDLKNKTLQPVLARLLVLNAKIDERTDWSSYCKITFPITISL